jgi:hypothetical protein
MKLQKPSTASLKGALNPGDILGFSGADLPSDIINIMTGAFPRWGLSHVGIMAEYKGDLLLFESTTFNKHPCAIRNVMFEGTQAQWPANKIENYNGRCWRYPLEKPLRGWERHKLSEYLVGGIGVEYDMIGALRSGGHVFNWVESRFHAENLARIYCSEWCAASLREIERFDTDDVSKWNPNKFVRELRSRAINLHRERLK